MKKILVLIFLTTLLHTKKPEIPTIPQPTPEEVVQEYCATPDIDLIFFAPDAGKLYKHIIQGLIRATDVTGSIKVAAFRFTEKEVAQDLIDAHNRGVSIEMVFDHGAVISTMASAVFPFCQAGIPVYQHIPVNLIPPSQRIAEYVQEEEGLVRGSYPTIMHQKTMIFTNTCGGKNIVVFGSLNFTTAGFYGNEEAVQVRNKPEIVTAFTEHFEKLKTRCCSIDLHKTPGAGGSAKCAKSSPARWATKI